MENIGMMTVTAKNQHNSTVLGWVEKIDGVWLSYTNRVGEYSEACHATKREAVAEVRREFKRLHGSFLELTDIAEALSE